ncbi:unnamed protein product [Microthlaspi erraticum]|uniref:F-box domain-containing protein n=1 Tax=Microthlaspi erraticum TaxID=1685480 RepID=A0A6D2J188_9BRAS|nr:unnamed protein product [Microthlaspi erraticum]
MTATTTMSNLPKELAEEILSRVPLKPVRLTCRKWNDLCQSQSFRKLHLGKLSAAMKEGTLSDTRTSLVVASNSCNTTGFPTKDVLVMKCTISTLIRGGLLMSLHRRFIAAVAFLSKETLTVLAREEKLSVLLNHNDEEDLSEFEIWITTKIEAQEVSWSKFLKVDMGFMDPHIQEEDMILPHIQDMMMMVPHIEYEGVMMAPYIEDEDVVMVLDIKGSFFIDEERKVVMGYEKYSKKFVIVGESGYVSKLDFLGEPADPKWKPNVSSYAPSLLQIKRKEATVQFEDLPLLKSHHADAGGRKRRRVNE